MNLIKIPPAMGRLDSDHSMTTSLNERRGDEMLEKKEWQNRL